MKKHARLTFGITKKKRFGVTLLVVAAILIITVISRGFLSKIILQVSFNYKPERLP